MRQKGFHVKLYLEGLRQTRVLGIVLAIITVLGSILYPVLQIADYYSLPASEQAASMVRLIHVSEFTPLLILFMFLAPVLLCMNLFSFLNSRKASDFYHGIPCTRTTLYISFSASILTWLAGIIALVTALNGVLYSIFPITKVNMMILPYCFLFYLSGSLFVMGAMMIAKGLTGTAITNIIVTGLIAFFPRLLLFLFSWLLSLNVMIVDVEHMGLLANPQYNIPIHTIFSYLGGIPEKVMDIGFWGGIFYTGILGLLYLALGAVIFQKRKSETAEKSAQNKWMQHIIRCLVTIPLTLIIPASIVSQERLGTTSVVLILFVSLIIYFGYELITTKKLRNLVTAIPILLVVVIFDVLFGFSVGIAKDMALSAAPDASQIHSVGIIRKRNFYEKPKYNELLIDQIYAEDPETLEMVAGTLKQTILAVQNRDYRNEERKKQSLMLHIRQKNGSELSRSVLFTPEQVRSFDQVLMQNAEYSEKISALPPIDKNTVVVCQNVSGKLLDTAEIWELYCQEYAQLTAEEKTFHNGMVSELPNSMQLDSNLILYADSLAVTGYKGSERYLSSYIVSSRTPNTLKYILNKMNENSSRDALQLLDLVQKGSAIGYDFTVKKLDTGFGSILFHCNGYEKELYYGQEFFRNFQDMAELMNIIQNTIGRELDLRKPVYVLEGYSYSSGQNTENSAYTQNISAAFCFQLTEQEQAQMEQLLIQRTES